MTHDELLAKIDYTVAIYEGLSVLDTRVLTAYLKALRAVVELHKPIDAAKGLSQASRDILGYTNVCGECLYDGGPYPCNTINAIEKELG